MDVGCGRGRVNILAMEQYGCGGIGVEIDKTVLAEARENVKKAGLCDSIEIIEEDITRNIDRIEWTRVSVIFMFLSNKSNLRMRDLVLHRVKAGTRIITAQFVMQDWEAEKSVLVPGSFAKSTTESPLYLYRYVVTKVQDFPSV